MTAPDLDVDAGALAFRLGDALLRDRSFVLGLGPLAAMTRQAACCVISAGGARSYLPEGRAPVRCPDPADADIRMLDLPTATTLSGDLHLEAALLQDPPRAVVDAVEAYHPEARARWWVASHFSVAHIAGRSVLARRRDEWVALEDNTVIDEVFDACGVETTTRLAPR